MGTRPILSQSMDETTFRNYYYLKEELLDFCRQEGLPRSGGKIQLTDRIACYLNTGAIGEKTVAPVPLAPPVLGITGNSSVNTLEIITKDTFIEPFFVCSEKHRAFFKQVIGKSFSFNVVFQKWLKANTGKTYEKAIRAYYQILAEKKNSITVIDKQFEYNAYIRAFFADNSGKTLENAIQCWKYKKALQGHNCYEKSDLEI